MNPEERKAMVKKTFNTVSVGYDNPSLRFFSESARHMAMISGFKGKEHVLDVATGTGYAALALAREYPDIQVTGIDFSEGMLAQARVKADREKLPNTRFIEMDMQKLEFPGNHFDAAVSAFAIFFVEDMTQQLKQIMDKIKPGGRIVISNFYENSFLPLMEPFFNRLRQYGVELPPITWKKISTEDKCAALFQTAGIKDVQVERRDLGYYLKNADEWWNIVWNGGFRGYVNQLSPENMAQFKKEHLEEIQAFATENGIWLNMEVLYTLGSK